MSTTIRYSGGGLVDTMSYLQLGGTVTQSFTIINDETIITVGATAAAIEVQILADTSLKAGARVNFLHSAAAGVTASFKFSGSAVSNNVTINASKTYSHEFIYDGTNFYPIALPVVVN